MVQVVTAICTAKIKMQDVNCAVYLCQILHRRYPEFSMLLLKTLQSSLSNLTKDDKVGYLINIIRNKNNIFLTVKLFR